MTNSNGSQSSQQRHGPAPIVPARATSTPNGFDRYHPPARALIDDCVHCGFCLPSCPTYVLWGEEMDSPRGRIHLMKQALDGAPLSDQMVRHFDLCLGCLGCMTACPSGVQYDKLIEATRAQVERRHPRSAGDRLIRELIFGLFPYPERLQMATAPLSLYQRLRVRAALSRTGILSRLPAQLRAMENLMPEIPRHREKIPVWTPPQGESRTTVGMLLGCVQRAFFPQVNAATVRVLSAEGCAVVTPSRQGCCGALSLHAGREDEARRFARALIDSFAQTNIDAIIVNSAGCGSAMKQYGYLLRDDPRYAAPAREFAARVRDASEFLVGLEPIAQRHPLAISAVYHDACHLSHGQGIREQPRALLRQIPGMTLHEVPVEADICCGSAGIYNMVEPEAAQELGTRKANNVLKAGADLLVSANPGCLLQIRSSLERAGTTMPIAHPLQVLDVSLRGQSATALTVR